MFDDSDKFGADVVLLQIHRTSKTHTHCTLHSPQRSPMPDTATGGRGDAGAVELPSRPGEDNGLSPGEGAPDLDSMR